MSVSVGSRFSAQAERVGSSSLACSSGRGQADCLEGGSFAPTENLSQEFLVKSFKRQLLIKRGVRVEASRGPPSRRRTEIRRRAPEHFEGPLGPGDLSDSDDFDVDLEYIARGGGTRTRESIEKQDNWILSSSYTRYLLGGMFVLGIAAGIALDSVVSIEPNNVASREVIDRQTPNPDICLANGMSALVLDQRLFVSFNPFNVYVSQAEVKPGCVLRQSNWQVLESRGLVTNGEVQDCKKNMNTFGFVGDLRKSPEVNCIYHSETAENQFLKDPSKAALGDGYQPKETMDP